jgi:hypothetical protein
VSAAVGAVHRVVHYCLPVFCLLVAAAGPKGSLGKQLGTKIQVQNASSPNGEDP